MENLAITRFLNSANEISREIVSCAIEVHRTLGGLGLLGSVYEETLAWELAQHGMKVERPGIAANFLQGTDTQFPASHRFDSRWESYYRVQSHD
ncbi:MAG: hypothetical protein C5S48_01665 [Candidatus Methanogaster sp.]|nr:MAG: hypothetical protein C5S48_01665 [ANME-2 cluster archaeon]